MKTIMDFLQSRVFELEDKLLEKTPMANTRRWHCYGADSVGNVLQLEMELMEVQKAINRMKRLEKIKCKV